MFQKVLIANRGEIAARVIKACREMGIASAVLYTDADRSWSPRNLADEAIWIGEGPAATSYINIKKVIDAAKRVGADAIHPGYGFLAENAAFARACEAAGIVFIGPTSDVIDVMGDKAKAKALVQDCGAPVIPGCDGFGVSDEELAIRAEEIGYPLMVKAVAGGGGMGMRIVCGPQDFLESLGAVRREAKASFGDDRVLLEKYFSSVRHIEVQVLADAHGNAVHLYERECSLQRRRQKILEEAPSPFVNDRLRDALCETSLKIVEASNYEGVGTVEFIIVDDESCCSDATPAFFFLEMNTRLQVEHGVTEEATGVDLVRKQIEAAAGLPLGLKQADISLRAHAIECRLCAEAPEKNFQPVTGTVLSLSWPEGDAIRVDTGVRQGTEITAYYDSLVAKLLAKGATRKDAIGRIRWALYKTTLLGVETNQRFLSHLLDDDAVRAGRADTRYVDDNIETLTPPLAKECRLEAAMVASISIALEETRQLGPGEGGSFARTYELKVADEDYCVCVKSFGAGRYAVQIDESEFALEIDHGAFAEKIVFGPKAPGGAESGGYNVADPASGGLGPMRVAIDGLERAYDHASREGAHFIYRAGLGVVAVTEIRAGNRRDAGAGASGYAAPMAGVVTATHIAAGAEITAGDKLIVMEAMKMEHVVIAEGAGVVAELLVETGSAVEEGALLLRMAEGSCSAEAAS